MSKVYLEPSSENEHEKNLIFNFYNMRCTLLRGIVFIFVFPIFPENCRNMISFRTYMILIILFHK